MYKCVVGSTVGALNNVITFKQTTHIRSQQRAAMDVCTELAVSCDGHSSCVNSPDSEEGYRCVCDSGYRQDGNSCSVIGTV